jgi:nitroreductase
MIATKYLVGLSACLLLGATAKTAEPGSIQLPTPQTDGGQPLLRVLRDRKTVREFSPKPLPAQLLSNLLWAGFGVNRPGNGHRTAPSAMNSQEVDIYVATPEGVFLYEPKANQLQPAAQGDLRGKTGGQDFVKTAPLALLFVADLSRLAKAQPKDRERYAWIDTGYISQNIYLFCASEGLATVVHEVDRSPLKEALRLRPDQTIVLAQAVGFPGEPARNDPAR